MQQVKYFFYGLSRNTDKPLDPRLEINSLSTIDTELNILYRFTGLIFFVKDVKTFYTFINDVITPVKLSTIMTSGNIFGLTTTSYSNLNTLLMNTNSSIGTIITVFPLGVSFIFDGTNWKYHSGTYKFETSIIEATLPTSLKSSGKLVIIDNVKYVYNSDLTYSTEVIESITTPTVLEPNRYYLINESLHYSINNVLYKINEKLVILTNYELKILNDSNLDENINNIEHNLNSLNICVFFRININNSINNIQQLINVNYISVDSNFIKVLSEFKITGDLIIFNK